MKIFTRVFMQRRFPNFRSIFVIVFQSSVVTIVYYATAHIYKYQEKYEMYLEHTYF